MKNRRIAIIFAALLTLMVLVISAVPALAADPGAAQAAQNVPQAGNVKVLLRLMLVQDEAKVDALLAQSLSSGKLTSDQVTKIKNFWTKHHAQFAKSAILKRLLSAKDGAKVQTFLDKAVQAGKIKQEQADKILKIWGILHPAPATNTN